MRILFVGRPHHVEALEQDWPFVHPAKTLPLETVAIDDGSDFPLAQLIEKGRYADAIGWWLSASRTETYLEQIQKSPELGTLVSDVGRRCHAFVTETHHRGIELERITPLFQKLYVPHLSTVPASDEGTLGWLPYGCLVGVREAEDLLNKPIRPQIDIVYPFNHYFLGDRAQRMTKILEIVRRLGLAFKCSLVEIIWNSQREPYRGTSAYAMATYP